MMMSMPSFTVVLRYVSKQRVIESAPYMTFILICMRAVCVHAADIRWRNEGLAAVFLLLASTVTTFLICSLTGIRSDSRGLRDDG
jgi:hypothetical protein